MSRRALVFVGLLLVGAAVLRADVAPYPIWRVTADGRIAAVVQIGDSVFIGGDFRKVGRAVNPFNALIASYTSRIEDLPDLACAHDGDTLLGSTPGRPTLIARGTAPFGARLRDDNGPFVVDDAVTHVRVGADCQFLRRFALRLPPTATQVGEAVVFGQRLFAAWSVAVDVTTVAAYLAAFDEMTGTFEAAWPAPRLVGSRWRTAPLLALHATALDGRRLAVSYEDAESDARVAGWFDPADGRFTSARVLPHDTAVVSVGRVVPDDTAVFTNGRLLLLAWSDVNQRRTLELVDPLTWQRLPQWPSVTAGPYGTPAATAVGGRLVVGAEGLAVDGGAPVGVAMFDAGTWLDVGTGAHVDAWTAPSWLGDGAIRHVVVAGSRLFVQGDFAPGAPRDSVAALDLATGALLPWEYPFAVEDAVRLGGYSSVVYLGRVTSTSRQPRRGLAGVDPATGELRPWPGPGFLAQDVQTLATDGTYLFVALRTMEAGVPGVAVRRVLPGGAIDPQWRLDLPNAMLADLEVGGGVVYAVGAFITASDGGAPQSRTAGAAVRVTGGLTAWNPPLRGLCEFRGVTPTGPPPVPCIRALAMTADRAIVLGTLRTLASDWSGELAALTLDTGSLDLQVPSVGGASAVALSADEGVAFATPIVGPTRRLARIDPGPLARLLGPPLGEGGLAARRGLVYPDVERDGDTGAATGSGMHWSDPLATPAGVLERASWPSTLALFPEIAPRAPRPPYFLTAVVSGPIVTLRWQHGAGDLQPFVASVPPDATAPTSHTIEASLTPGGPPLAQIDTASAYAAFTVLAPPGTYYVRVRATNRFGTSGPSDEARVDITPSAPDAPRATIATMVGDTVRIGWQAAPGGWPASGYHLEVGLSPGTSNLGVVAVSGTELVVRVVRSGFSRHYYVRVRAVNAQGASAPGNEVAIDVPP
jgi:hypothetical protein